MTKNEFIVDDWNRKHVKGTRVIYWLGLKEGPGRAGITNSPADQLNGTPVVCIEGVGAVALTHVEPESQEPVTKSPEPSQ